MTPLEDKLRAALRETAAEIPAAPPPLRLSPRRRSGRHRWITWAAPLASAAVVIAVVAGSLALTGGGPRPRATTAPADATAVPPYYVALTTRESNPNEYGLDATAAEVRATATGAVLARVVVPKPYVHFTGVTAAADDRTFVLVAAEKSNPPATVQQEMREYPHGYYPALRFYLLHIDPASATPSGRASLRALPAGFIPANNEVHDMALSPDGNSLAADVGGNVFGNTQLYVFNLAIGTKRAWSFKGCSRCNSGSGGLGFGGLNVDALSWTADGRHIAFVGPGRNPLGPGAVWLLDTNAPGSNLLADSKLVVGWPGGNPQSSQDWRGGIITPDGRTVLIIEELAGRYDFREALVKASAATGQVTATLNNLKVVGNYEQVLYTNATGNMLVVSYTRPGTSAGILHGDTYTPIPWTPHTATAAW